MSSAAGLFLDCGYRIPNSGIDDEIRAEPCGMGEFAIVNVDCAHVESHRFGILDRQVPETPDAGDSDPFSRPRRAVSLIPL